jgi:hypothetical protein
LPGASVASPCEDQHQLRLTGDALPLLTGAGVSIGATVVRDMDRRETPALPGQAAVADALAGPARNGGPASAATIEAEVVVGLPLTAAQDELQQRPSWRLRSDRFARRSGSR